jgi:non-ribosomal peptide synthetase component F
VVVGLAVERSVEMLVALLGILKSGAAYVPLDSSFPAERLRFLIEDSGASGVVSSFEGSEAEDLRAQLKAVVPEGTPILLLEDMAGPDAGPVPDGAWKVPPGDLAYILYTSGSTGRPKGVEVTHASVVNFMESMAVEPGLTARDALLAVTTLSFDIALLELVLPLVVGGRTLVASRATASEERSSRSRSSDPARRPCRRLRRRGACFWKRDSVRGRTSRCCAAAKPCRRPSRPSS